MRKSEIKVTALMPNYNYEKYIPQAFDSLLQQTFMPSAIVFVDDNSTDNSWEVINNCVDKCSHRDVKKQENYRESFISDTTDTVKVILIRQDGNRGPSATRNVGIRATIDQTDLYAMLDSDDVYHPNKIEASVDVFVKYSDVGLVYSDYVVYNEEKDERKVEMKEVFDLKRMYQENIVSTNSVISTEALKIVGLYDEEMRVAEDYDLWLRLGEMCCVYHIAEPLFEYRVTGKGASFSVENEIWQKCWQRVQQKSMERRNA